jgi:nucleoid DNA-binding protein
MVADQSDIPVQDVDKVFAAREKVIKGLLATGAKVRIDDLGFLQMLQTKPTRRREPHNGTLVEVPARTKVVFREIRKTIDDSL